MPPAVATALVLASAYLIGSLPFGYLVGRLRGVDLFRTGSGNIGATNVGRVLGRKYGVLVFLLDFAKGAVPVAGAAPLARWLAPGAETLLGPADVLKVGAAGLAFLGHLFPVYLGFRGGKGVATGAGTILVLVPGPTALAVFAWVVAVAASRMVSVGSLAAVAVLSAARLLGTPGPFDPDPLPVTLYCLFGSGLVAVKHRGNVRRLVARSENRVGEFSMRQPLLRGLHVVALGLWFGGAAFFNFVVAPLAFATFEQVVNDPPSDRTAFIELLPRDSPHKKALASALFGAAVGPVFPYYFGMQAVCGLVALVTAATWWGADDGRKLHQWRVITLTVAVLLVAVSWPISQTVAELRPARYDRDTTRAKEAKAAFDSWHLVSLSLSLVTTSLAGVALAMAARLPQKTERSGPADKLSRSDTHAPLGPPGKSGSHAALNKGKRG